MDLPIYRSTRTVKALKIKSVVYGGGGGGKAFTEIEFEDSFYPKIRLSIEWGHDNCPRAGDYLVEDEKNKITCYESSRFEKSFAQVK